MIQAAITASGLSARRFAHVVAFGRDERTIRRWQSGDVEIPPGARARIEWFLALSDTRRRRLVAVLQRDATPAPS